MRFDSLPEELQAYITSLVSSNPIASACTVSENSGTRSGCGSAYGHSTQSVRFVNIGALSLSCVNRRLRRLSLPSLWSVLTCAQVPCADGSNSLLPESVAHLRRLRDVLQSAGSSAELVRSVDIHHAQDLGAPHSEALNLILDVLKLVPRLLTIDLHDLVHLCDAFILGVNSHPTLRQATLHTNRQPISVSVSRPYPSLPSSPNEILTKFLVPEFTVYDSNDFTSLHVATALGLQIPHLSIWCPTKQSHHLLSLSPPHPHPQTLTPESDAGPKAGSYHHPLTVRGLRKLEIQISYEEPREVFDGLRALMAQKPAGKRLADTATSSNSDSGNTDRSSGGSGSRNGGGGSQLTQVVMYTLSLHGLPAEGVPFAGRFFALVRREGVASCTKLFALELGRQRFGGVGDEDGDNAGCGDDSGWSGKDRPDGAVSGDDDEDGWAVRSLYVDITSHCEQVVRCTGLAYPGLPDLSLCLTHCKPVTPDTLIEVLSTYLPSLCKISFKFQHVKHTLFPPPPLSSSSSAPSLSVSTTPTNTANNTNPEDLMEAFAARLASRMPKMDEIRICDGIGAGRRTARVMFGVVRGPRSGGSSVPGSRGGHCQFKGDEKDGKMQMQREETRDVVKLVRKEPMPAAWWASGGGAANGGRVRW